MPFFDIHILQFMAAARVPGSVCVTLATRALSARLMKTFVGIRAPVSMVAPAITLGQTTMFVPAQPPSVDQTVRKTLMSVSATPASMEGPVWLVFNYSCCLQMLAK